MATLMKYGNIWKHSVYKRSNIEQVKDMIEDMAKVNGKKVVILGHSLGTRCVQYFLNWVEKNHVSLPNEIMDSPDSDLVCRAVNG